MRIADAGNLQRGRERVAVDLRVMAGARHGTHVNEPAHRVDREQSNKLGERPVEWPTVNTTGWGSCFTIIFLIVEVRLIGSTRRERIDSCVPYRHELPLEWGMVLEPRPTEWR